MASSTCFRFVGGESHPHITQRVKQGYAIRIRLAEIVFLVLGRTIYCLPGLEKSLTVLRSKS
jgi:hypothetical protein